MGQKDRNSKVKYCDHEGIQLNIGVARVSGEYKTKKRRVSEINIVLNSTFAGM